MEMEIDRRTFMTTVGGAVAAANWIGSEACSTRENVSAAGLQHVGAGTIDPKAFLNRANADGEFLVAARYWDARLRLEIGDRPYDVLIQAGKIADFTVASAASVPDVKIAGPAETWADPRAVISMVIPSVSHLAQGLSVEGDTIKHVAPYQAAIVRLIGGEGTRCAISARAGHGVRLIGLSSA